MTDPGMWQTLIDAFGPAGAAVIFALAIWGSAERKERIRQSDGRVTDARQHSVEMIEIVRTIDKAVDMVRRDN